MNLLLYVIASLLAYLIQKTMKKCVYIYPYLAQFFPPRGKVNYESSEN